MIKQEIIDKLQGMGIVTENAYPKASFLLEGEILVSFFERELKDDFYFYNTFDKKIYKVNKPATLTGMKTNEFKGNKNYLIPLDKCELVWEDKVYVELPDEQFNTMTLRQYACIHLREPQTGLDWLDKLITEANRIKIIP